MLNLKTVAHETSETGKLENTNRRMRAHPPIQ